MNQMQATTSGSYVTEYGGGYGGFEVNEMMGPVVAPVGVPEMNSLRGNEVQVVQVNNAPYYPPQAENTYYYNSQEAEIMDLKANVENLKHELSFLKFEGNCYQKEKEIWKTEADLWKTDMEKWKSEAVKWKGHVSNWHTDSMKWKTEANNWQADSVKWKTEAKNWKAESGKWKAQAEKFYGEYCKALTENSEFWRRWKETEAAKAAISLHFENVIQKIALEGEEKDKIIEKLKKELLHEQHGRAIVQAEVKAQIEEVERVKNHEKMALANLQKVALAKENEMQNKMENETMKYEKFAVEVSGRVNELEDKVRSLQTELDQKDSILGGFNRFCGQLKEENRQVNIQLRELKDFMTSLTCDFQDNLGKFMRTYGLKISPQLESKWDWRTEEERCLVSHLRMLVTLTECTFQEWEEKGMLKGKQICGAKKTKGIAAITGGGVMDKKRPEKRQLPGCSPSAPGAAKSGSSKKLKI